MTRPLILRVLLVVLILLECCFLFAAFSDSHIDRPSTARAWFAWRQHPSSETEAVWKEERRKLHLEELIVGLVIWSLIIATGAGIYYVVRKQKLQV